MKLVEKPKLTLNKTIAMNITIKNIIRSHKLLYKWKIKDNFFIISTGRTATNFFGHFFNENFENVLAFHEPAPDLYDIGIDKYRNKNKFFSSKSLLKIARFNQYKKLKKSESKIYIESNPNLSFLLAEIKEFFPESKILYITRDLPSYLISAFNKSPDNSNKMFFYDSNDHRKRITPFDFPNDPLVKTWNNISREEKIAWYWKTCNEIILENISNMNYLQVKYEDIFLSENKKEHLKEVINFFNFPIEKSDYIYEKALNKKRNTNSKKIMADFEEINILKKKRILEMTYNVRKKLNYIQ